MHNLIEYLNVESREFERAVLNRFQSKVDGLQLAKKYALGRIKVKDTVEFINKVGFGGAFSRGANIAGTSTYQELISTGNFILIQNETIKKDILSYYAKRAFLSEYTDNLRTEYAGFVNSRIPFNPQDIEQRDSLDFKRALIDFKREEFLNLVNKELTFGYSVKIRIKELNQSAKELINKLNEELNRYNDSFF